MLPHCRRRGVERVCVWRCAKLCRAKVKREREERVGTRALVIRGCWVIGWDEEPVVEEGDESVDDIAGAERLSLESFREGLLVCTLVGWSCARSCPLIPLPSRGTADDPSQRATGLPEYICIYLNRSSRKEKNRHHRSLVG